MFHAGQLSGLIQGDGAAFSRELVQPSRVVQCLPVQLPLPPRPDVLPPARTSGFAVASLVLGIAGFNPLFFAIPSILAIWFGFSARHKISRSSGLVRGKGIATAGTALGVLSLIGFVVFAWMTTTQLKQCNGDLFCGM